MHGHINPKLSPGDVVELKTPSEILRTLDDDGALDTLPFMPEMLEFAGKRLHVARRALTTCVDAMGAPPAHGFWTDDVVTIEGARCSGSAHGGCKKACMIFWREAWLRKTPRAAPLAGLEPGAGNPAEDADNLRAHLKVASGPNHYYCQTTELFKATHPLSRRDRLERYLNGFLVGNFNALQILRDAGTWLKWTARRKLFGDYGSGPNERTPEECLNLEPGEWVQVKSERQIIETLNKRGFNRGLHFSPDMRRSCGKRYRVKARIERIIMDNTGRMRPLQNTVWLDDVACGCSYNGFGMGGCSRCEITYWREIWLNRCDGPATPPKTEPTSERAHDQNTPNYGQLAAVELRAHRPAENR